MSTWRAVHAGARAPVPPVYGSGRPAFSPLPSYADAAGSSLHQRGGTRTPTITTTAQRGSQLLRRIVHCYHAQPRSTRGLLLPSRYVCTNLCTRRAKARRHSGDAQTLTQTRATHKPTSLRPPETARDGRDVRRTAHNPAATGPGRRITRGARAPAILRTAMNNRQDFARGYELI